MITNPEHGLVFGALDLIGNDTTGSYYIETMAEGTSWGNPEQLIRAIETFLQDGAIQVVDGYGNRELSLEVKIVGEDSPALALGEAALFAEVGKRNTLTWTPPNIITGSGTPCVFDVVSSRLDHSFDDWGELRLERRYKLTITALPFARAQELTEVPFAAPTGLTPTVVTADDCTSTSQWLASYVGSGRTLTGPTVVDGVAVSAKITSRYVPGAIFGVKMSLNSVSIDVTTARYIRIDMAGARVPAGVVPDIQVIMNGLSAYLDASNGTVNWYAVPDSITTTINNIVIIATTPVVDHSNFTLTIFDVSTSTLAQDAAGSRQTFRTLPVAGSARTPGNLELFDPIAALGSVLVYTTPNKGSLQQPPLRVLRTTHGDETADTSLVSGAYSDLVVNHLFDIPAANVPAGGYLLVARIKHASAGTYAMSWSSSSRMGSTSLAVQSGTQPVTLPAATWTIAPIARTTLPTMAMGSAGKVRISLAGPVGVLLDEAWLFNVDTGHVTIVECGTGTPAAGGPSNRVWIDAASLDSPVPSVWLGNASDRSDAFGAGAALMSMPEHEFVPPSMNIWTCTTGSVGTGGSLSFYQRAHTHVVDA